MLLERTIFQLDVGHVPPEQADAMGHAGYLQWLGGLPGDAGYINEANRAYEMAYPFIKTSPAVAVFCQLLSASASVPPVVLELKLPGRKRRGGAKARRGVR